MQLSPHFTLDELTHSDNAVRLGLDNTPPAKLIPSLIALANGLEEVRLLLAVPLSISSAYRSGALNAATPGSSATSQHVLGQAADCRAPKFGNPYVCCAAIRSSKIAFDQLILEYDSWFHISFAPNPRRQILTKQANKPYQVGLINSA